MAAPDGTLAKVTSPGLFRSLALLFGFPDTAIAHILDLHPVANARVFLVNVDNTGRPIGAPLAASTTDADGFFVFNVPKGTNLGPTASTLTVIQAAVGGATAPVPIGTAGVLNVPAVQQLMLVDPGGELGTRRMLAAGLSKFSASSTAGYVGLIQSLLAQQALLVGHTIDATLSNITANSTFQNEVLPILADIEGSLGSDQSFLTGTYSFFGYSSAPDTADVPFHRAIEQGSMTFDPMKGRMLVTELELGGSLKELCTTTCSRTFTLQPFDDRNLNQDGMYFRTAGNRVILSAPGSYSFAAWFNPTATLGIAALRAGEGKQAIYVLAKHGMNVSGADFSATFNYVTFGSILNQTLVNNPAVVADTWTGPLQSRAGSGTLTFSGGNAPVTASGSAGGSSITRQAVTCSPAGSGCTLSATLISTTNGESFGVGVPHTVLPNGEMVLVGSGSGAMNSDRSVYAAAQFRILFPYDTEFSVVVRQPSGMTPANLNSTYRIITLEDQLMTSAQISTRLSTGTAQFDGVNNAAFAVVAGQVDRTEGCLTGTCSIDTRISPILFPVNELRSYGVTTNGILTFSAGNIPPGATVTGGVSPDASFFVVQTRTDNIAGTSTRAITLGIKAP